ncbi:MAG: right-handed parallel beta-helix repeat-containing protein, partial [Bacteroidota bacterium]
MRYFPILFLLCLSTLSNATNYYVSTSGNDANPGTISQPFRSIQYALNTASNLETLFIEGGIYNERVTFTVSGTESNPITITSYNGVATIDGNGFTLFGPYGGMFEMIDCNHLVIDNLRVQHSTYIGFLVFGNDVTDITIRNCSTFDTGSSGIYANGQAAVGSYGIRKILIENNSIERAINRSPGGYEECISLTEGVENFTIRFNEVFNGGIGTIPGGPIGIDAKNGVRNGVIHGNVVYDMNNSSAGIYVDAYERSALNIQIYQNEVFGCEDIGISIGAEQGGTVDNISVFNNLIYNNGADGIKITGFSTDGSPNDIRRVKVYNNTVFQNGFQGTLGGNNQGGSMWVEGNTGLIEVRNNIFADNNFNNGVHIYLSNQANVDLSNNLISNNKGRSWSNPPMQEINGQFAIVDDPGFVDVTRFNFNLDNASPAIDAGTTDLFPSVDFNNDSRPFGSGVDIGAFENQLIALPVELMAFNATFDPTTEGVDLNWTTATEVNAAYFDIESSPKGRVFQAVGRLSAFGNSQAQTKYHFKDGQALKGERYYRLKQVDADGSFVYSPIV